MSIEGLIQWWCSDHLTHNYFLSCLGYRIANGSGYGDFEYSLLRAMNVVDDTTPILTLVHDSQITDIPAHLMKEHDVPVDYIITNTRVKTYR